MRTYLATILIEWAAFVLVVVGVRRSGTSVFLVLGDRWRSFRQFLRDIGVAVGFWVVAVLFLFMAGRLLHVASAQKKLHFVLPHGGFEIATWIALSITAGICEETIFRGYLQRQFMALTQSAAAGILFSAATFGAAHAYQGLRLAIVIGVFGAMFGVLAYWRGTVRPGMIAHAWQDSLSGIVGSLIKH
jgi:membrane protease YdiL (CAAX protease family)